MYVCMYIHTNIYIYIYNPSDHYQVFRYYQHQLLGMRAPPPTLALYGDMLSDTYQHAAARISYLVTYLITQGRWGGRRVVGL